MSQNTLPLTSSNHLNMLKPYIISQAEQRQTVVSVWPAGHNAAPAIELINI